ncbi:glucosyltransferase [Synechococcus phage DSL-LC02]|nr:glucosyltransferase [Synechococcus phage DSL-LC02]
MKVAIAFIGTSKYLNFLPQYYEKIRENFLPNTEKTFLVFTDGEGEFPEDVKLYPQEHLEWPYITLTRFEILNKAREEIVKNDWLVFLDADTLVVDKVLEEDFFSDKPLFGVWHPCHNLGMPPHNKVPGAFETNPLSLASFNFEVEKYPTHYYQGCLWGGKVPEVLDMIDELESRVKKDLEKNVIAVWHDESHLNKYFIENYGKVNTLGPEYAYPEVFAGYCDFEPKIVHLAKDNSKYQQ